MTDPQWLELPISQTSFHGPKDVRAFEVILYIITWTEQTKQNNVTTEQTNQDWKDKRRETVTNVRMVNSKKPGRGDEGC